MLYTIADFYVEYTPKYHRLAARSEKYKAADRSAEPEITIDVTEDEIDAHIKAYDVSRDLAEYVLMGAKFYKEILDKDAYFLHSSAVSVDGNGYAFTGPCGAGKSTHSALWRKYFGNRIVPVNDDKPVLKIVNGTVFVCGTPFSGKHDINTNTMVPLKGICVMNQAKENSVRRLKAVEATGIFLEQTLRCDERDKMMNLLNLVDFTLTHVPVYKLSCNISFEAVELAFSTMNGETV